MPNLQEREPILLPNLQSSAFDLGRADVRVIGVPGLEIPHLALTGDEDAFAYDFSKGFLYVEEKESDATNITVVSGDSHVNIRNTTIIGNSRVTINGVDIVGGNMNVRGTSEKRKALLSLPIGYLCVVLAVDTKSGNTDITHTDTGRLRLDTMSGDINVAKSTAELAYFKTMSGDIDLEEFNAKSPTQAQTMSGDIRITDSKAPSWDLRTMSGDIKTKSVFGRLATSTMSGRVRSI